MTVQERDEYFTVDAKLLRELGERLVGRPHIALAELIKNAYDADARLVEVRFRRDRIEVVDDGHGMSEPDFIGRWLRIATDQKERDRRSFELAGSSQAPISTRPLSRLVYAECWPPVSRTARYRHNIRAEPAAAVNDCPNSCDDRAPLVKKR